MDGQQAGASSEGVDQEWQLQCPRGLSAIRGAFRPILRMYAKQVSTINEKETPLYIYTHICTLRAWIPGRYSDLS